MRYPIAVVKNPENNVIHLNEKYKSKEKTQESYTENEIELPKIIHGTIDFKPPHGMLLGFNVAVEGEDELKYQQIYIINDGSSYCLQVGGNKIIMNHLSYLPKGAGLSPEVEGRWNWSNLQDFLKNPCYASDTFQLIKTTLINYIEFQNDAQYGLVSGWAIATYFAHLFPAFPFLLFFGPKETGKSKVEEILVNTTFNAIKVKAITEAALGDTTDGLRGTVLFDQAEYLPRKIVGFLADSYKKAGAKRRIIERKKGKRMVREFSGYGPKAFATTRILDQDLRDRCCQVNMQRTTRSLPDFIGEEPVWSLIRNLCYRFLLCKWREVQVVYNTIPPTGTRKGELWRPLEAVLRVLEVSKMEIDGIKQAFDQGTKQTKDALSLAEEALFQVLFDRAQKEPKFELTPNDILQAMKPLLGENNSKSEQWVGKRIKLFNLADRRKKRTRKKTMHYRFKADRVLDVVVRYLGDLSDNNDDENAGPS